MKIRLRVTTLGTDTSCEGDRLSHTSVRLIAKGWDETERYLFYLVYKED